MDINQNINTLINDLQPIHKTYLNDNMILIKLHNNKIFKKWLQDKNIMPTMKSYHSGNYMVYNGVASKKNDILWPQFITVAVIKKGTVSKTKFVCCDTVIKTLSTTEFQNKDKSSGVAFNGSFFFLSGHINLNKFGVANHFAEYNNKDNTNINSADKLVNKPIGYYQHKYQAGIQGISEIAAVSTRKKSTRFPIETDISVPKYNDVKESLNWIKEELGILIIDKNNNYSIKTFNEYKTYEQNGINQDDQILLGNLLVHNNNIIMKEELMSAVVALNVPGLVKGTRGTLCKLNGELFKPSDFGTNVLPVNASVGIKIDGSNQIIPAVALYNSNNIMLPFNISLIITSNPHDFAGAIPPAIPMHASDKNPRTCALIDVNGNLIVMVVEGRNDMCGGRGIDLFDLAKLCKEMGAVYALNLDGGGSSQMFWKEIGISIDGVEPPQNNYHIGNGIIISEMI